MNFQGHKGITAVVAIVLLLMMTVGAAGLAYVWVTNLQQNIQTSAEGGVQDIQAQQDARISIDSVWNASSSINFTLRNSGRYTFDDQAKFTVFADGAPATVTGLPSGIKFAPKETRTVSIPSTTKSFPAMGTIVNIKVTTDIPGASTTYRCSVAQTGQQYC